MLYQANPSRRPTCLAIWWRPWLSCIVSLTVLFVSVYYLLLAHWNIAVCPLCCLHVRLYFCLHYSSLLLQVDIRLTKWPSLQNSVMSCEFLAMCVIVAYTGSVGSLLFALLIISAALLQAQCNCKLPACTRLQGNTGGIQGRGWYSKSSKCISDVSLLTCALRINAGLFCINVAVYYFWFCYRRM